MEELDLFRGAGLPTEGILGAEFTFRFEDEGYTGYMLRGTVGATVVWKGGGDGYGGERIIITPSTPFPETNFGLIRAFYYDVEKRQWYAVTDERKWWREGDLSFA